MKTETLFDPIKIFDLILSQLKTGEITVEQANKVGQQMPDGYTFEFEEED